MLNGLNIGLSALTAGQRGLDLTGENLANASTPGYHLQSLVLVPRVIGDLTDLGVEVQTVQRARDLLVEHAITINQYQSGQLSAEVNLFGQLESLFTPGTGSLGERTSNLFDSIQQLAAKPDDLAQRRVVLASASSLAGAFNQVGSSISQLGSALQQQIGDTVQQINTYTGQIADFNKQIQTAELLDRPANQLLDQHDEVLNKLASLIDVRTIEQPYGVVNVIAANAVVVAGGLDQSLTVQASPTGQLSLVAQGTTAPLNPAGGTLAGQLDGFNQVLPGYQQQIDELAQQLAASLDTIQATGLGLTGTQTSTVGARAVTSPTAALQSSTALPVQAGVLTFSITDLSTGQRSVARVAADPATQSLQDLANQITTDTTGQVQASVTANNELQLQAQAGFAFDLSGRLPTGPANVSMNGTAVPTVTGQYTGQTNGTYSFQVAGSGTVGVTAGLTLEVRDTSNTLVASLNIGQGYTPGTALTATSGLTVRLSAGTTAAGSFDVPVTSEPDTTGLLAALGINSLFTGSSAGDIQVRPELLTSPELLAASRDGNAGDAANLTRMLSVQQQLMAGGSETIEDFVAQVVGDVGAGVKVRRDQQTALASLGQNLLEHQQSVSGVDPNEELAQMLLFQRMFQMAAKYITTVNSTMDDLLAIIR